MKRGLVAVASLTVVLAGAVGCKGNEEPANGTERSSSDAAVPKVAASGAGEDATASISTKVWTAPSECPSLKALGIGGPPPENLGTPENGVALRCTYLLFEDHPRVTVVAYTMPVREVVEVAEKLYDLAGPDESYSADPAPEFGAEATRLRGEDSVLEEMLCGYVVPTRAGALEATSGGATFDEACSFAQRMLHTLD